MWFLNRRLEKGKGSAIDCEGGKQRKSKLNKNNNAGKQIHYHGEQTENSNKIQYCPKRRIMKLGREIYTLNSI